MPEYRFKINIESEMVVTAPTEYAAYMIAAHQINEESKHTQMQLDCGPDDECWEIYSTGRLEVVGRGREVTE